MLQKYSCFCTKGKEQKKKASLLAAVLNNKPSLREQGHRDVQGGVQEKTFEVTDLKEPETAVIIVDNKAIKAIGNGSVWYDPCPPRPPPPKKSLPKGPLNPMVQSCPALCSRGSYISPRIDSRDLLCSHYRSLWIWNIFPFLQELVLNLLINEHHYNCLIHIGGTFSALNQYTYSSGLSRPFCIYLRKDAANMDKAPTGLRWVLHYFSKILVKVLQDVVFKKWIRFWHNMLMIC